MLKKSLSYNIANLLILKILIATIVGILIESNIRIGITTSIIGFAIFASITVFLYITKRIKKHALNFVNGFVFAATWIFFGMFVTDYHHKDIPAIEKCNTPIKTGIITQQPEEKKKSYKAQIAICDSLGRTLYETLAYFQKDSTSYIPQIGDLIAFVSPIKYIDNANNPLEFNYKEYMALQGVYCQTYIKNNEYSILAKAFKKDIKYYGAIIRNSLIETYKRSGINGQQLAVLEALTLGYKADLEQETISSFQSSGAMHILAVSGLHTGIIMLVTNILLSFLNYNRKTIVLKCILIISTLWGFAAITGFSSSVCRSALMFSIITFSQILNRKTSTYNSLAVSAFILLTINPMLIYNIGFGLSYIAVLSIISIVPLFEKITPYINPAQDSKTIIILKTASKYILGIIIVSIAAQMGTCILSIKTFNIFPTYFLLTNIIVIPLSYFIMISAVALQALCFVPILQTMITEVLKIFLYLLTTSVEWIEELPMSCVHNIFLTTPSSILLYAAIIFAIVFVYYRKPKYMKATLILLCLYTAINTIFNDAKNTENQIIIYNMEKCQLYSIINGESATIYTSDAKLNERAIFLATGNARLAHKNVAGILNTDSIYKMSNLFFDIKGKKFCIIQSQYQVEALKNFTINTDYVVIAGNTSVSAENLITNLNTRNVIFDSSNTMQFAESKTKEYAANGINCYNVANNGAFVYGDGAKSIWWY